MQPEDVFQLITTIGATAVLYWRLTVADAKIAEQANTIKELTAVLVSRTPEIGQALADMRNIAKME